MTKTFVICDARSEFLSDVQTSALVEGYPFDVTVESDLDRALSKAAQSHGTVVISENIAKSADPDRIPRSAYGYAVTPDGNRLLSSLGVRSIGKHQTSGSLLAALSQEPVKVVNLQNISQKNSQPQNPQKAQQKQPQGQQSRGKPTESNPKPQQPQKQPQPQQMQKQPKPQTPSQPERQPEPKEVQSPAPQQQITPEMMAMFMQMMQQMGMAPQTAPQTQTPPVDAPDDENGAADEDVYDSESADEYAQDEAEEDVSEARGAKRKTARSSGSEMRQRRAAHDDESADEEIDEDLINQALRKKRTVVTTVYAAKGGVGKTSIATELAVCLALTTNGRKRFRVCIVDYNIDFGDVSTTLELADDGPNMTYWAAEIREMIERGEDPDSISFTKGDMEAHYLQRMKETGLYALCAPITHEDSMLIKPDELEVMLKSIISNGEFDYVVCDTGNNTRDSSIIALDNSDYVLLVATQDVTTANCNASVLRTLRDSGFDTDKVRLVINNAMPSRDTGISVQEVEETFPYPCVCRIKRTPDIIKANNLSRPLVYKPNHEYTKQIRRIVRFVTQGEIVEEPKKKLLSRR